jgi:hypothetical protein
MDGRKRADPASDHEIGLREMRQSPRVCSAEVSLVSEPDRVSRLYYPGLASYRGGFISRGLHIAYVSPHLFPG